MEKKKIHPLLKLALEIGPIMIFFISYKFAVAPDGATDEERQLAQLLFATGIFIPTILISLTISWVLHNDITFGLMFVNVTRWR